jgi:O-antigen ligase
MTLKKITRIDISYKNNIIQSFIDRDNYYWIKLGVVLLVLMSSIILGVNASLKSVLLLSILVIGFIGFVFLLRRPELGVILLIPISFFTPWEVSTGRNINFNLAFLFSIAIIGIWIIRVITTRIPIHVQTDSISILSIMFIVATVLSLLAGQIHWMIYAQDQASFAAQLGGWLLYILPIGIMLYVQTHLQDLRWLKILTWLFICLGAVYIIMFFLPSNIVAEVNIFTLSSTTSMTWTWLAALTFGQLLFNKELPTRWKIALGLLTIAILAVGLSADRRSWVSGWLPPLLAIGTILWLRSWRLGLASTLLAIILFGLLNLSIFADINISNQYSLYSRSATYPIMFELIKANPIIGLGFANYSHYTSLYPILGWYVSFNSHNNYVDINAQTGVLGLILFLSLMISICIRGWKLHKLELGGFSSGYIHACIGGLVGMLASGLLADWFLPYLYNIGIPGFRSCVFAWIFIGGLLAIKRIIDKHDDEKTDVPKSTFLKSPSN